ncbi:Transcription cofactor vestigial-like protein 1 [Channa argus]|uniref:Transcription cofactor vestigial-like protein 1 n=1 Tax=Channa argus TaxID=215402 RepID=A0A6G1PUY3_CHAAH|nr:Transcription cofactor vestigial-like protein 1 [Channa argus]KAK2904318.1 hypothetical protein Q8A73_010975 [Channa argus]
MEERTDSPIAVRVEEHSQYVILTYFQGDINSMVDAHFSRALSRVCQAKTPKAKPKKVRKTYKSEDARPCQASAVDSYRDPQVLPQAGRLLSFSPSDEAPSPWHSLAPRAVESPGFPSIACPLPPDGLGVTGQQYATSLLNLLHTDQGEMGPSMASSSKPEMLPNWTVPRDFRESTDSLNAVGFEHERHLDKKDLYWY